MVKQYIEFRKQNDFSGILTDTFGFIRNEFKPFMRAIFTISGPAILIFMLSLAFYNYTSGDIFDFTTYGNPTFNSTNIGLTIVALLFYVFSGIAAYILCGATVLFYIKSYVDNKGLVNFTEVKSNVYKSFWSFFGLGILKGITLFFAALLCLFPVLYAMVPMAIVFSIYVFESRRSVTDAYSESFSLVNIDFWTAFGSFLVFVIIYYVIGLVFSIPTAIYTMVSSGIFSGEIDPSDLSSFTADPILIFLNMLNTFFQFLMNIILVVGGAVIYFHLYEKTNFTGTYDRISEIGKTEE